MFHIPVLAKETAGFLLVGRDSTILDLTCGGGAHLKHFSDSLSAEATLIGIDRDPEAVAAAKKNLSAVLPSVKIVNRTFDKFADVLMELGIERVDGILMDLGISSHQVDSPHRGFSFMADGPLDMRMGPDCLFSAEQVVNEFSEKELSHIFREFGEEKQPHRLARAIGGYRQKNRIVTTGKLTEILSPLFSPKYRNASLARCFQAIRIVVNREIELLQATLPLLLDWLSPGGRIAVIAYHSLEDRTVKNFFATEARTCLCPPRLPVCVCGHKPAVKILTRKVIRPTATEITLNSRARSARLRVAEKMAVENNYE